MGKHHFENLEVWKRSCRLAVDACVALSQCRSYGVKDQIERSAISIPSNIAEGAERFSDKDFARFLDYNKGSCGELRTQLLIYKEICRQTEAVAPEGMAEMIEETIEISKMLGGLLKNLR